MLLSAGCMSQFDVTLGHNAEGASPFIDADTVDKCAEVCQSIATCVAFDFNKSDKPWKDIRCWVHENPIRKLKEQPNVDHYTRGPCSRSDGRHIENIYDVFYRHENSLNILCLCYVFNYAHSLWSSLFVDCMSNFDSHPERNADGGSPQRGFESVSACADRCRELPECVAFDYDRNDPPYREARCWIHNNSQLKVKEQPAVDHYTRIFCPRNAF